MEGVFSVSESWRTTYPGAVMGILIMDSVANPSQHEGLEKAKVALENELRSQFSRYSKADIKSIPPFVAYANYYKRFDKTYHVLLQFESVVTKSKPIPRVASLVEAMFMAELKTGLLTAGHDFDAIKLPIKLDIATGVESYIQLGGKEQTPKPKDMMMIDAEGVICTVLYGSDYRTRITNNTRRVFFAVYAPPGIDEDRVLKHLGEVKANVTLISPSSKAAFLQTYVG